MAGKATARTNPHICMWTDEYYNYWRQQVLEEERDVAVAIPGVNPDKAVRVTIPCCTPADATEDTGNHSVGTPVAVPSVTASTTIQTALTGRPRRQHQLPAYLHDYEYYCANIASIKAQIRPLPCGGTIGCH
nr:hypothetical protein Iba_chr08eCG6160 [Ipomoea batatas]